MNPAARTLSAALALTTVATGYFLLQSRMERPVPRLPTPVLSAARPAPLPFPPPTAREIVDRAVALDLRGEQIARLKALDRSRAREASGLKAVIQEAERDFSDFLTGAQGGNGASLQEIQRRSAEVSRLSAELRERRQHHADAALQVLADWQRQRLAQSRPAALKEGSNEGGAK